MTNERYQASKHVTLISIYLNVFLSIIKMFFGYVSYSQALFADGVHSLSDLMTDALVLIAAKFGSKQPDLEHPYGHGRIETIATVLVAIILGAVGIFIAYDAFLDILRNKHLNVPGTTAMIVAAISVLSKESLYHYMSGISKRVHSNLLRANAWHNRSDAFVSLIVLIGIIGAKFGWHYMDAVAAIIVAVLIVKMSIDMIWHSIRELIDTGVEPELLKDIRKTIHTIPGVESVHQLRTRSLGGHVFIDVHVIVDPHISVSEGHYIGDQVLRALLKTYPHVKDVTVHVDPEDDELMTPSSNLPPRKAFENKLREAWKTLPGYEHIKEIHLHYLSGKIEIELFFTAQFKNDQKLSEQYHDAIKNIKAVGHLTLYKLV